MNTMAFRELREYLQRIIESEGRFGNPLDLELGVRSEGGLWSVPLGPVI